MSDIWYWCSKWHATQPLLGPLQAKCSCLLSEDNKNPWERSSCLHTGGRTSLRYLNLKWLLSQMRYVQCLQYVMFRTKEKEIFTNICIKKQTENKCQFFKNNIKKRKNTEFLKIPPTVRFSVVGPMRQNFGKHTRRTCFHIRFIGQHLFAHCSQATARRSQVFHSFQRKQKAKTKLSHRIHILIFADEHIALTIDWKLIIHSPPIFLGTERTTSRWESERRSCFFLWREASLW